MTKNGFTRRRFLQRSAGVAGASFLGGITVLEPKPLPAASLFAGANDKIRFGIVAWAWKAPGC